MYKALYRKYRSKTFDQMLGQEFIVKSLKNQIINNEISHAYLFSGTRGTGKTSAAKIFARAVNCENPIDGNPCNKCESCISILNDLNMDVVEMDAASNNGVDDIRQLKEKVIYPPTSLKYKVYIIDEVHMLSKGAFNALLKILEEPPRHLIFILATTEIEKIPATILSRTQKFEFKRIAINEIIKNLKAITEEEGKSLDDEVYLLIAKNADGSMRDALSVLDQLLSFDIKNMTIEDAVNILGISSQEAIFKFTNALINRDLIGAVNAIDELADQGKDFLSLNNQLLSHFRDLMLVKTLQESEKLVFSTYLKEFKAQAQNTDLDRILEVIDGLKDLQTNIKYAENPRILMEMTSLKICSEPSQKSLWDNIINLRERIKSLEEGKTQSFKREDPSAIIKKERESQVIHKSEEENFDTSPILEDRLEKKEGSPLENESKEESFDLKAPKAKETLKESKEFDDENNKEEVLSLKDIREDWPKILDNLKAINQVALAGVLIDAKIHSFANNLLDITFAEGHVFHIRVVNDPERLEIIKSLLKKRYNRDIEVRFSLEKDITAEKLENLFDKNIINRK